MTEGEQKKLHGAARLSRLRNSRRFLHFLDPAERKEAGCIAKEEGCEFASYGGFEDAERQIGCFYMEGYEPVSEEYPITCLTSSFDCRFSNISHRDVLGAYMALGLTRACLGDIIIMDSRVYLFTESSVSSFIADNFQTAGKTALCFSETNVIQSIFVKPKGTYFRAVIGSFRLDAVISAAFRLSRSSAASLIKNGNCKLDYLNCDKTDAMVSPGSILSLRGMGRVRLISMDGITRKDRISVTFFRYD